MPRPLSTPDEHPVVSDQVGRSASPDIAVVTERIAALDRLVHAEVRDLMAHMRTMREDDKAAIETAHKAASALAEKHNDLIRAAEKKDETYATKDETQRLAAWQSRMGGGILVAVAIGLTNLVKLWFT